VDWLPGHNRVVGFESIRLRFEIDAPSASNEEIAKLIERTKRYCTVSRPSGSRRRSN
jgi:hypothetical protein